MITNAVFQSDAALFSRLCPITKKPSTTAGAVRTLAPVQRGRLGRLGITDEVRRCRSSRRHMGRDRCLSGRLVLIASSLRRNAVRWRYWIPLAEAGERKLLIEGSHAARRLSHVVRCACFACCLSLLPFHLYPGRHLAIARRLLHVRHRIVSVARCLLHVCTLYALSVPFIYIYIFMLHIEGCTSSVPHCTMSVARALVARRLSWPMPSY